MATRPAGLSPSQLASIPASTPPPGVIPNFVNPESNSYKIHIASAICLPSMLLFVALRLYAKLFLNKQKTFDDVVFIIAFITTCTFLSLGIATVNGRAFGHHAWDVTLGEFTDSQLKLYFFSNSLYSPFIWVIKVSLLLLFRQLFSPLKWMKYLVYFGITFLGLFYLATMITTLAFCLPTHNESWIFAFHSIKCTQIGKALGVVTGILGVISDFYILFLPLPAIWNLRLGLQRKIGISMIFLTGLIACVSSILRLVYSIANNDSTDTTWNTVPLYVVCIVEMTSGMIVLCMPSTAAVINHIYPRASISLSAYTQRLKTRTSFLNSSERYQMNDLSGPGHQLPSNKYQIMSNSETAVVHAIA